MDKELRILILEDIPSDADLMMRELNKFGLVFVGKRVETKDDYVKELHDFSPDIILADYMLPNFDGMSAMLIAKQEAPEVPFIFVTGSMNEEVAVECMKVGAADYVIKEHLARLGSAVALALDISRAKKEKQGIENNLRESQEKYSALMNDASDAIMLVDLEGKLLEVNKKTEELLGYTKDELLNMHLTQLPPKEEFERAKAVFRQVLHKGSGAAIDSQLVRKDGTLVTVDLTASVIKYSGKKLVQGIFRDVTAHKKIENALKDGEKFLSDVFMSIQDGVSVLDCQLNILRVNSTLENWHSYEMPLIGKKCYQAYHGLNSPCKICPTLKTLETKMASYAEIPKGGPNGKVVGWLDLYTFPLIDAQTGQMKGVIEYVRDITARKKAELDRLVLNEELLKTNKRLKHLSLRDPHTGLYNHNYLPEVIDSEFYRSRRYAHPLSVIMLDVDYFKSINEVYGHPFGDLVLLQLAGQLKKLVRRYDIIIRFGGEEFIILSPGTDRAKALVLAQRLLDAINLYNFGNKKHTVKLKLSLAVATYPDDRINKGIDLIELTEKILDKAKEMGGNRVYCSSDMNKEKTQSLLLEHDPGEIVFLKDKIEKLNKKANQNLIEAIFAFAKTIELKDRYTGAHVESTVQYATGIARALKLSTYEIELVRQASMLHDLGKIGISEKILLKKSKLTRKEFEEIKKHPKIAADILRPVHTFHPLIPLILYHHERWDGKGYPEGLKGEEIPVGARVVSVADTYQALISDRPYHKAYSKAKAMKIIKDGTGTQFDPDIATIFLRILQGKK